jgi:hypothetical protein
MADIVYSGSLIFPIGMDVFFNTAIKHMNPAGGIANVLRGISIGGPTDSEGNCPGGRHLQPYLTKSVVEGSPTIPSLELKSGYYRFRWVVQTGSRTIAVNAKQSGSVTGDLRPSLVVKANPNIGINQDLSSSAAAGAGWTTIGPISISATGTDATWVELHNMNTASFLIPAYFDHIVVT